MYTNIYTYYFCYSLRLEGAHPRLNFWLRPFLLDPREVYKSIIIKKFSK